MRVRTRRLIVGMLAICLGCAALAASGGAPLEAFGRISSEGFAERSVPTRIARFTSRVRLRSVAEAQAQTGNVRQGQSTTTLADGRVLIAGGDTDGSAEIYDPSTGLTASVQSRMVVARASHGAVLLADGNVLIVGGYAAGTASVEQGAEIFDVATAQFTKIGGSRTPRVLPTLTRRADEIIRIAGGDAAGSTEFYNPATQTFGEDPAAPSIATDRDDYAPGEMVTLTGTRWVPGEIVTIVLREDPALHDELTLYAVADENGNFTNTNFAPDEHDIGVAFQVTATGATSNLTARTSFTDAAPPSSTYSISTFSASILGGGTDIGNHCDDCITTVITPFPVTFYNNVFSSIRVSSNGNIHFGSAQFENPNFCLSTGVFPGGAIMPYWDDLRTDLPGGTGKGIFVQTTGSAPNRQYHIRWNTSYWMNPSPQFFGSAQFAVVFYENQARIDFIYGGITGNSATIGVQRSSSGPATQYACNISSVPSGTGVSFTGVPITTATTTTLTSSPNPSGLGQNATFTATVRWNGNAVTSGTVSLSDGATVVASGGVLNASGQAVFSLSNLTVGSHPMTASYSGSSGLLASSSGVLTHVVNKGNTATTVASSANPSVIGQPVTLTALVGPVAPASSTPSGSVQFKDAGVDIGAPVTLSSGSAALSTTFTSTGPRTITAVYSGDASFNSSTSPGITHTVNKAATATAVSSDVNPSVFGQAVTLLVDVSPASPASGTPGGTVQFKDNGSDLGSPVMLSGGGASLTTSALATGMHTITAVYGGDSSFNGSTSSVLTQTVNKAPATITITSPDLNQTYNGSPRTVGYSTSPAGLSGVAITYNGSGVAPTTAGNYAVVATLTNPNYEAPNATGTLLVNKAPATVALGNLSHTYDGSPKPVTATTSPGGLTTVSLTYDGLPTPPTGAGSYAVVATLTNTNYEAANATGTLVINKAAAALTLGNLTHTYDGSPKAAVATTSPVGLNSVSLTYDGSPTPPTAAGSYTVVASLTNGNYQAPNATATLVINKAAATLTLGSLIHTYDGSTKGASATTNPAGLTGVLVTYNGSPAAPTNGGSYAVVASLTNTNYEAPNATGTLVINKAAATLTLGNLTQTYDGSPKAASAATSPAGLSGVSLTYDGSTSPPTAAGSYTVVASLTNTNYEATNGTGTLVIGKASATITLSNLVQTYDASPKQVSANSSPAGLAGVSILYNGASTAPTNAGSYAIVASLDNANYEAPDALGTLVVGKATATLTLADLSHTYNGSPKTATVASSPDGLTGISLTYSGAAAPPTEAGNYAVVASLTHPNYQAPDASGTLVISQAPATLSLGDLSHTYDGSPKAASTISGPVGLNGIAITYNGSAASPINAGTYTVVAALTNNNYAAPNATATMTIGKATATVALGSLQHSYNGDPKAATATTSPAGLSVQFAYSQNSSPVGAPTGAGIYEVTATIDDTNYQGSASDVLSIAKATATLVLSSLSHTYDGTVKAATVATTPSGLSGVSVTYNGSGTSPVTAGSYAVTATLNNANYEATPSSANLVIAKANPTLTWPNPAAVVYGTALGGAQLNATANVPGQFVYTPVGGTVLSAGSGQTLSVAFTPTDTNNYHGASKSIVLTVNPAPLTITAESKSMILNDTVPTLTATYSGFVNGDTTASLLPGVTVATAATGGAVGSFPITASGAANPNYTITHVGGNLTVSYATGICVGQSGRQVLEPMNVDGSSVFKRNSTVPVKFRVCDVNGSSIGSPGVVSGFAMTQVLAGTVSQDLEVIESTTPDSAFRWDPSALQWIFNLSTKSQSVNRTYVYRITLADQSVIEFRYGLR